MKQTPPTGTPIQTKGKVDHIEVENNTVMWSVSEPLCPEDTINNIGMVYLINTGDMSQSIPIKVSDSSVDYFCYTILN